MDLTVEQLTQLGTLVSSIAVAKYTASEARRRADAAHKRIDSLSDQHTEVLGQLRELKARLEGLPDKIASGFYEKLIAVGVLANRDKS